MSFRQQWGQLSWPILSTTHLRDDLQLRFCEAAVPASLVASCRFLRASREFLCPFWEQSLQHVLRGLISFAGEIDEFELRLFSRQPGRGWFLVRLANFMFFAVVRVRHQSHSWQQCSQLVWSKRLKYRTLFRLCNKVAGGFPIQKDLDAPNIRLGSRPMRVIRQER